MLAKYTKLLKEEDIKRTMYYLEISETKVIPLLRPDELPNTVSFVSKN